MMLNKIISIKNAGRFKDSFHSGNTTFAKHTFIYGANGYGKTTICSILRSLKTNNPNIISGRKTLGSTTNTSINLLTTAGNINFNGTIWNDTHEHIAIFDNDFIAENVHSGDVVETDHRRNLYRVIIGQAGVALAEQEVKFANDARAATGLVTANKRTLETHIPQSMNFETFIVDILDDVDPLKCAYIKN